MCASAGEIQGRESSKDRVCSVRPRGREYYIYRYSSRGGVTCERAYMYVFSSSSLICACLQRLYMTRKGKQRALAKGRGEGPSEVFLSLSKIKSKMACTCRDLATAYTCSLPRDVEKNFMVLMLKKVKNVFKV